MQVAESSIAWWEILIEDVPVLRTDTEQEALSYLQLIREENPGMKQGEIRPRLSTFLDESAFAVELLVMAWLR